jgi:hypothetical protein
VNEYSDVLSANPSPVVANYPRDPMHTQPPSARNEQLRRLTDVLAQAAKPKYIILFGSQARGDASDTCW